MSNRLHTNYHLCRVLIKKMNCETWVGAGFGEVLVDAMRRDDPEDVVRTNACNHWLPATVRLAIGDIHMHTS